MDNERLFNRILGTVIVAIRHRLKVNQLSLAARTKLAQSTLSRYELGQGMQAYTLITLAEGLGVPVALLLSLTEQTKLRSLRQISEDEAGDDAMDTLLAYHARVVVNHALQAPSEVRPVSVINPVEAPLVPVEASAAISPVEVEAVEVEAVEVEAVEVEAVEEEPAGVEEPLAVEVEEPAPGPMPEAAEEVHEEAPAVLPSSWELF